MATDFHRTKSALTDFLATFQKLAEDPNREGVEPDDVKEGKPQTDEKDLGDGTAAQGAAGKETSAEIKANSAPSGTSVEGEHTNAGEASAYVKDPKANNTSPTTTAESPAEDIDKMDSIDPSIKKACAQQIILESRIMDILDRQFNDMAAKTAAEAEVQEAAAIIAAAQAYKAAHVKGLSEAIGCTAKVANDILNQVADEDPTAVLPEDTLSDADAEAILAEAAAADAAQAEGAQEFTDEDEAALAEQISAELQPIIEEMQAEGYSDQEIVSAILEEGGISEEEVVDLAIGKLEEQGFTPEESVELIQSLGELQQQGATPEELAAVLGGGQ
jgi:hypothetical protein